MKRLFNSILALIASIQPIAFKVTLPGPALIIKVGWLTHVTEPCAAARSPLDWCQLEGAEGAIPPTLLLSPLLLLLLLPSLLAAL
jgi:hypothetical protein